MKRIPLQVAGLIVFVTLVRAIVTANLELTSVESYLWVCSQRPAMGYFDYPGMIAWMGWLSTSLFGHSPLGVRTVMILGGAAMIWFVFLAARRLYDEPTGRLAAFVAALVPEFFAFAAEATPDAPCLLFWSACVWALAHALSGDSPRWWYLAGAFLGLAMDSKYHAVFLGFGVFGFLLLSPDHRAWLKRKEPWLAVIVALLAFSPTLIWNARNGWQSFAYQGVSRFKESGFQPSQLYKFPVNQLLLVTPVFCVWAWVSGIRTLLRWRSSDWRDRLLAALGMPMLIFFFLVIFSRPVRGHWPVHGYVTALILSSAVVLRGGAAGRRLHLGSLGVLAAGYLILPIVVAAIPRKDRTGWTQLAVAVAIRKADFVVCNEYHLASQMGYLLRTPEAWELTPVGKPSKNFPNWWRLEDHLGKNAVVVYDATHYAKEPERVKAIVESFERVGPVDEVLIPRVHLSRHEDPDRYMIFNAWNYRGPKSVERRAAPSEDSQIPLWGRWLIAVTMKQIPLWGRWLIAVTIVRAVFAALIPPTPEEAYHWDFARHLDWSYYDHPGMIAWSIALGRLFFGDTSFAIRFIPLLFAAGTTAILARLAKKIYGEPAALWAVLFQTIQPITYMTAASGFPDSPMLFFWAATMALVWEALDTGRGVLWIPAGFTLGLGMISKYTIVFFGVSMVCYLLTSKRDRRWLATPWPYLSAIVALLAFTPVTYWNAQHDWASIRFQGKSRFDSANEFLFTAALKYLGLQYAAVLPFTLHVAVQAIRRSPRSERPAERYFFWCFAPMFLFFFAVSWTMPTHVLWPLPCWLGITVVMSGAMAEWKSPNARKYGIALAAASALLFLAVSIHAAFQIPKVPQLSPMHGWDRVATKAKALRDGLPEGSFYLGLGRKYFVASQLAFHLPAPYEVYGRTPLGESDQQFDFWTDVKALEGRDAAVLIEEFKGDDELEAKVRKCFRSVDPVEHLTVILRGGKPLRFALFRAHGYIPTPLPTK